MISSLKWVPQGAMAQTPSKHKLTPEDIKLMERMAAEEAGQGNKGSALKRAMMPRKHVTFTALEVGSSTSEGEESDDQSGALSEDDSLYEGNSKLLAMAGLVDTSNAHASGMVMDLNLDNDDESDQDDYRLQESDAVLLAAKSQEDYSSLEVHVYNYESGNFYVHHDVTMPTFPLAVEWLNFATAPSTRIEALGSSQPVIADFHRTPGSFAAIGTFNPGIEIYDLDVLEVMEPDVTLGGPKSGGATGTTLKPESHKGAVMSLSWNRAFRNLLASGSADGTAKIWDLATQQCRLTMQHHSNKVQTVIWNPAEQNILATGSFDKTVAVVDARTPQKGSKFALPADIEDLQWNPHAPFEFAAGCEDGTLLAYDIRKSTTSIFTMKAHNEAVSSIAFSLYIPGLLATCSTDTSVKVFDLLTPHTDVASKCGPRLVTSKKMNVGPLYSISLFPGKPFLLSAAGQEGAVAIWDGAEDTFISRCFTSNRRLSAPPQYKRPQPNPQTIQGSSQQQVTQSHADIDNQEVASSFGNALGALEATSAASKNTKKNGKKGKKKKKKKR